MLLPPMPKPKPPLPPGATYGTIPGTNPPPAIPTGLSDDLVVFSFPGTTIGTPDGASARARSGSGSFFEKEYSIIPVSGVQYEILYVSPLIGFETNEPLKLVVPIFKE